MSNLIIWDSTEDFPMDKKVILWKGFSSEVNKNIISVLDLIDQYKEEIRHRYLRWSYDLSEKKILDSSIRDHFELKPNFSFWWTSAFSEKSNFSKSPEIDNIIKLLALRIWIDFENIKSLRVKSRNKFLLVALKQLSDEISIEFSSLNKEEFELPVFKINHEFKAIVWFIIHLFKSRKLKGIGLDLWKKSSSELTFFSYLSNINKDKLALNTHQSNFWGNLPNKILDMGYRINWLHIFTPSNQFPSANIASNTLNTFNETNLNEVHVFLESFVSFKIIIQTLRDWLKIRFIGAKIKHHIFHDDYLLQVMSDDWDKSFYGINSISNCLNLNLFFEAMNSISKQKLGFFLQENQSWEIGLNYCWNVCNHHEIIGVPHSTTRFWDLRYANDSRIFSDLSKNCFPAPSSIAINGEAQRKYFESISYPASQINLVEALRFFHLDYEKEPRELQIKSNEESFILILGDYLMENNEKLIEILISASSLLPETLKLVFKPHPACHVPISKFQGLDISVRDQEISILLANTQFAFSSNVTTAAIDVYFRGIPLACMIDSNKLNLSPMLEIDKNVFVKTHNEMVEKILLSSLGSNKSFASPQQYFELDRSLPRWLGLIENRLDSSKFEEDTV